MFELIHAKNFLQIKILLNLLQFSPTPGFGVETNEGSCPISFSVEVSQAHSYFA